MAKSPARLSRSRLEKPRSREPGQPCQPNSCEMTLSYLSKRKLAFPLHVLMSCPHVICNLYTLGMTLRLPVLTNSLPAGEYFSFSPFSRATHYKQTNPVKVTRISKASIGFNKQNNNSARASRTFLSISFYTTTT